MTLTEFLLARIADRESVARDMQHQERFGRPPIEFHGGGTGIRELVDPARVLAECEAKRRIVDECRALDAQTCDCGAYGRADDMLRALAAIYAGHPDYREEWKP